MQAGKKKRQIYLHHQVSQLTSTLSRLSSRHLLHRVELQEDMGCVRSWENGSNFSSSTSLVVVFRCNDLAAALKFNLPIARDKVIAIACDTWLMKSSINELSASNTLYALPWFSACVSRNVVSHKFLHSIPLFFYIHFTCCCCCCFTPIYFLLRSTANSFIVQFIGTWLLRKKIALVFLALLLCFAVFGWRRWKKENMP